MPRKPDNEQRRMNEGWPENKTLNHYRRASIRARSRRESRYRDKRYWQGSEWSPSVSTRNWFVIRNPHMKPLLHKGRKP